MKLKDTLYVDDIPEVFHECEVLYEEYWDGYEEGGFVIVFEFFDEIMQWNWESSVFIDDNTIIFDPFPITIDDLNEYKNQESRSSY